METRNAIITETMFGREDHGILTFMIFVKFGGCGCGIGGYALDMYDRQIERRVYSARGMEAIANILDVVGVDSWEKLKGSYIRVKDAGWGNPISEIGNLMEDKWFNLKEFFGGEEK